MDEHSPRRGDGPPRRPGRAPGAGSRADGRGDGSSHGGSHRADGTPHRHGPPPWEESDAASPARRARGRGRAAAPAGRGTPPASRRHRDDQTRRAGRSLRDGPAGADTRSREEARSGRAVIASTHPVDGADSPPGRRRALGRAAVALVSLLALVVTGVGWWSIGRLDLARSDVRLGQSPDGAMDILLVGIDSRTDAHGKPLSKEELATVRAGDEVAQNTDTMLIIRVPNDGSSATAISIPRDTYITDRRIGETKINGVYGTVREQTRGRLVEQGKDEATAARAGAEAGRQALIDSVTDLTGVSIDHYAEVGLLGFVLLTDAVGGVDVCLNAPVNDKFSGANFPAGRQTLPGPDALSFVRQRHGLPRGDLDRIVRQQAFMASLAGKVLSTGTLTNPAAMDRLGSAVERSVVLDSGWDVLGFVRQLQNLSGGNVRFETIPVLDIDGVGAGGQSVVLVDRAQVRRFAAGLIGGTPTSPTGAPAPDIDRAAVSVDVYNSGSIAGLAGAVARHLSGLGYVEGQVANTANAAVRGSYVQARENSDTARAVAADLGGLPVVVDSSLPAGTVRVVLGDDYAGPGSRAGSPASPGPTVAPSSRMDGAGPAGGAEAFEHPTPSITAGGGPPCVN